MREDDIEWDDIDKSRNMLLSKSDWTQLPDTGLSSECVNAWREWRQKVRSINQKTFKERIPAVLRLKELRESQPDVDFSGETHSYYERQNAVVSKIDIKRVVMDILKEIEPVQEPEQPQRPKGLEDMPNISEARKHAQNHLEQAYHAKIRAASPPLDLTHLYTERLNEAIDLLAGTGTSFPLLEVLADSLDKELKDVAENVLRKHSSNISAFAKVEEQYIKSLKEIKDSGTISQLKETIERFNGH